ncbi:MAG: F0F1 ATP synthase subunit B [Ruminococcaceae bacterium]|nr:F0F1 ATP synthase subunit B [Oscillospiraceae bacterium]
MNEYLELISLNIWHIIATILNLLILMWIIKKFLFKPVQKVLAERQNQVDEIYSAAEKSAAQAEADRKLYNEKLEGAREEAEAIVKAATKRADRLSDEIIDKAKNKAEETIRKAENDIAQEKKKAMNELKNEISDISVQIAENVVGREIKAEDHRELIDDFIDKL